MVIESPLRVLHILGPLRPSGMERMLVSAAEYFRAEGIVSNVYGLNQGSTYADELRRAGYGVTLGESAGKTVRGMLMLRRVVREQQIDVIHIHTEASWLPTALVSASLLTRSRGAVVRTVHSTFQASGRWLASRRVQAWFVDRFVSAFVAPSPEVAETERSIARQCQVIYNWVDDRISMLSGERARIRRAGRAEHALIVGNCGNVKRHELALEAIWRAGLALSHIGDETLANGAERALLRRFEDAGRLVRRGVQAPDRALIDADLYCMPSRVEGFGVALAEALVAGVPSLVSDSPGLRWADAVDGVKLLPDDVRAWESALTNTPANSSVTFPAGINFSANRGAREYAALYRSVVTR